MIGHFDEKYAFLSNFYPSLIFYGEDKIPCATVEHYFQMAKTNDWNEAIAIAQADTPGKAKRLGRKCHLRPDWETVKDSVMEEALRKKFSDPDLRKALLDTGDEYLEEGTTWHDNYWGVCHCAKCQDILGKNKLGKLLMKLRAEIREGE